MLGLTLFKEYFIIGDVVVVPFKSIVYINDITHAYILIESMNLVL